MIPGTIVGVRFGNDVAVLTKDRVFLRTVLKFVEV